MWRELAFDPFQDEALTGQQGFYTSSKYLEFDLRIPVEAYNVPSVTEKVYVYLGRDLPAWDESLAIPLFYRGNVEQEWSYLSEADTGDSNRTTPARAFATTYWSVGKAALTVCSSDKDFIRRPDESEYVTSIRLGYADEPYQKMYAQIRHDVQFAGSAAHLSAPLRDQIKAVTTGARPSAILSLYDRLENTLPRIESLLAKIARSPATDLELSTRSYAFGSADEATRAMAVLAPSMRNPTVHRGAFSGGRAVPMRLSARVPVQTADTAANKYARRVADQVILWLRNLDTQFDAYLAQVKKRKAALVESGESPSGGQVKRVKEDHDLHQKVRDAIAARRRRLERIASSLPTVHARFDAHVDTAATLFEPRYVELRRVFAAFAATLHLPDVPGGDSIVETDIEPFHALFERWAFQRTVDALRDLGFEPEDPLTIGYDRLPVYNNPAPGLEMPFVHRQRLSDGSRLVLCYGKVYPRYRKGTHYEYGVETRRNRTDAEGFYNAPDIAIELFPPGESVPDVVVFDASLSARKEAVNKKAQYTKSLRSFFEDYDASPGRGRPRIRSREIVRGSYCVAPIWEGHYHAWPSSFSADDLAADEKGPLYLPPDKEDAIRRIASVIERVFDRNNFWSV